MAGIMVVAGKKKFVPQRLHAESVSSYCRGCEEEVLYQAPTALLVNAARAEGLQVVILCMPCAEVALAKPQGRSH